MIPALRGSASRKGRVGVTSRALGAAVRALATAVVLEVAVAPGAPAAAQDAADTLPPADTAAAPDTLPLVEGVPAVDSTRLRILERLEALGRPPGGDSARLARDSAELAQRTGGGQEQDGQRPQGPSGGIGAQDSLAQELMAIPGYAPTGYSGTSADFEAADRRLTLRGDEEERPRVSRQGMILAADSAIVYEEEQERVRAVGNAEYTPETGDAVASNSMVLDLRSERASALGAETRYNQGGTEWIVHGDLPSVASEVVHGSHAQFTSCDLEVPHYHFETDQIKIHQGNVLVARPVRLYFADVPVAWLPFIAQSLAEGRASGLLAPRFSVNDIVRQSRGYSRRISNVGFYWAMSDYSDATFALDWFSDRFTAINASFRYAWLRQFLNGNADIRHYWRESGSREFSFNTSNSWEISERTRFSMQARYASENDFVRENSFDPREVTQSIRSQGGLNHRFDWGSLNLGANRQQHMTNDRVEMTLPSVSLSLNPVTFFDAPPTQAGPFNNITWNGSLSGRRQLRLFDVDQPLDSTFQESRADQVTTRANASSSFSLGNFSVSQGGSYDSSVRRGIPDFILEPEPGEDTDLPGEEVERIDLTREELSWNGGVSYQQRLIGSTTLTPRLQVRSRAVRSDTLSASSGFVAAPMRTSFGARLKTDVYGFYGGIGSFERIRHKLSPSFSYDYSPEVAPNTLQREVFGSREVQTRSVLSVNLNQTFEAKEDPATDAGAEEAPGEPGPDPDDPGDVDDADVEPGDAPGVDELDPGLSDQGLERVETGRAVTLLGLQTSVITYDFVEADSTGSFLGGFQTTRLRNSVRSDYLRGISLQFSHDLFEEGRGDGERNGTGAAGRRFAPHLSSMNLSFSLDSSSALFRWIGLGGGDDDAAVAEEAEEAADTAAASRRADAGDEASIVPGGEEDEVDGRDPGAGVGDWSASFSYSLQRPRIAPSSGNQMLQVNLGFQPTQNWDVRWRTSYDFNRQTFNDHMISLTRDLHRWQANFDFRQTATGNWSFRFQVSLLDNRDLEFDYEQRSQLRR